jgi:GMP synthase-like glutamine amidotransferase
VRIGLLQCDRLDPEDAAVDGDYDVLFEALLAGRGLDLVRYRADQGHLPTSTTDCDGWIIPGSRLSVYDDVEWIHGLARFTERVLADDRPLVGVCFGHQMIGRVLGAPVERAPGGWNIGAIDYRLHWSAPGESAIGDPARPNSFRLVASHRDQVLELPSGAELLASAPTCPVAAFTAGRALAIQGHPEFTAALARSLHRKRLGAVGPERVADADASLDTPLDRDRVGAWIAAALTGIGLVE